jgi:3-methyladenine DNA glycosylase AlkD
MQQPEYTKYLSQLFKENANPENAVPMKRYMRNQFDFFGIKSPERRELYKIFKSKNGLIPNDEKFDIVKWCWEQNEREYQMFAMEFLGKSARKESESIIDLYQFMITNKSWWDTVDYIASNLAGVYFQRYPQKINDKTSEWMDSENMWLQRTCLLFQLKYRSNLDTGLLNKFIVRLSDSNEFFIQKAIGWILREYSKTNPEFVIKYINENKLANLSQREGLLYMKKKGTL